jgi:putative transposase
MSHISSSSTNRPYGVVRVCQEWGLSRATFYHQQDRAAGPSAEPAKRGPKTAYTDEVRTADIRQVLMGSPFLGEGHRKVWARLRAMATTLKRGSSVESRSDPREKVVK